MISGLSVGHGENAADSENTNELLKLHSALSNLKVDASLREQFIATLTHDLKTPLAAISLQADIVRREDPQSKTADRMTRIIDQVRRMDRMIQEMLDVSLIRSGRSLPLRKRECDLECLLSELIEDFSSGQTRRYILECEKNIVGHWDQDQIRRAVSNLIQNAAKYGAPNSPIRVSVVQDADYAKVLIHNFGPAIPASNLALLFKPYHRLEEAQKSAHSGWGLGLTIVKGVIDAHGGCLQVSSTELEGTVFGFQIPKRAQEQPQQSFNFLPVSVSH